MATAILALLAIILDLWLGEPHRGYPIARFSQLAEHLAGRDRRIIASRRYSSALIALLLLPSLLLVALLALLGRTGVLLELLALYLALGYSSLERQAQEITEALRQGRWEAAAIECAWINPHRSPHDPASIRSAAVEGILDNSIDAVYAPLFWFALLGAPGALLYRLTDQLDRLWGEDPTRYQQLAWTAHTLDRLLNWLPARLTAFTFMLLGNGRQALRCWRDQRCGLAGSKRGVVVATGAGALNVTLVESPPLTVVTSTIAYPITRSGSGSPVQLQDLRRAVDLVYRGIWLWLTLILLLGVVV